MMDVTPEPAACPPLDQHNEHNYDVELGDITMADDMASGEAGPGLMDDAMLDELLEGIQAAAETPDRTMDMRTDMTAFLNLDSEDVEMDHTTVVTDPAKASSNNNQDGRIAELEKDYSDGIKTLDTQNPDPNPNQKPSLPTSIRGKLMSVVIPASTVEAVASEASITSLQKAEETTKSVEMSEVVAELVERGEGNDQGQAVKGTKRARCFEEESSPEPDDTIPSKTAKFGERHDPSHQTTPVAGTASPAPGKSEQAAVPYETATVAHIVVTKATVGDDDAPVTTERNLQQQIDKFNRGQAEVEGAGSRTVTTETESIRPDEDADTSATQQMLARPRQDSAHGEPKQDGRLESAASAKEGFDEASNNSTDWRMQLGKIRSADEDLGLMHRDDFYGPPAPVDASASKNKESTEPGESNSDGDVSKGNQTLSQIAANVDLNDHKVDFCYPIVPNTSCAPSLSLEKLIVLALVGVPSRRLTLSNIIDMAKAMSKDYNGQEFLSDADAPCWTKRVEDILHGYDFPTNLEATSDGGRNFHLPNGGEWFILNRPRKDSAKPFKLRKLPLEVRLKIYTFVLHLPLPKRCGWTVDKRYALDPNGQEIFNDPSRTSQHLTTKVAGNWELRSRPIPELLALTMASKAMQKESLPVFYRTNVFYFLQPLVMGRFLSGIPNRLLWIRNVILNFAPPVRNHQAKRSIGWLFSTKLRNLHLIINEQDLLIKDCVHEITDIPGVKFLAELSGLDKVGFSGECPNLKRYLAKANITSFKKGRGKDASEWDTDEEVEAQEGRRAKDRLVEMKKAFKNKARDAMRKESKMKKEVKRKQVAQRAADMAQKKKSKEETQAREKKRKREEKERKRQEREDELEEERGRKEANRLAKKAASKRKAQAREEEKAAKREERETTRAEKKAEADRLKKEKRRAAEKKIEEQRRRVAETIGHHAADDESSDDDDNTDSEDSDAGPGTARDTTPNMGWYEASHSSSSSRSPDARQDSSSDDDEEPEPPKKKARTTPSNTPRGKAKATAPVSRPIPGRSSGQAPQKNPPVSNAMKLAAMRKTLQKGNSGAQVKTSVPAGPSRAPTVKSATKAAGNKNAEPVMVSDDGSSGDGESDDDDFD